MFNFKFVEEIAKTQELINVVKMDSNESLIEINERDALIDLSPCIQAYQKTVFFSNYDIDAQLTFAFQQNEKTVPDLSKYTAEQKLLMLVSQQTHQNRYYNQVKLPLVNPVQHNKLMDRLSERLDRDENVQGQMTMNLNSILFKRPYCVLWNTRNNELFKVSVEESKVDAFLAQVYRVITKQKSGASMTDSTTAPKHVFRVGERVCHSQFGNGVIVDIRKTLRQSIMDVVFDNRGKKTIAEEYLKPVA